MKDRCTYAPVMTLPEGTKGFIVYCDASIVMFRSVLIQHWKVIDYASRKLKVHERNYQTHVLELAVVVFTLMVWKHLSYGVHVNVYQHQKNLQYVFIKKEFDLRQRGFLELLKTIT